MRFQFNPFTDKLDISGMGPGATSVDFVTGNTGGVVSADANYNINIVGNVASGITTVGNQSPSTLTIYGLPSSVVQVGTTAYATNAEAAAQSSSTVALTPSNITSMFSTHYLPPAQGGTGLSSPAANSLLVTDGTSPFVVLGVAGNGQLPIGSIGSAPVLANITSLGGSITITNGPGSIDLATSGSVAETLTGNSGGAVSPTAGNINTVGTGSITVVGSPGTSTLTTELTGLTNHNVLVGAGTSTITNVPPVMAGYVLTDNGPGVDPSFQVNSGAGAILTIAGDSGSISGPNVTIYANRAANNCGSSVAFVNSGTISTFNLTDSIGNTILGNGSGNATLAGTNNTACGGLALPALTGSGSTGLANCAFGWTSLNHLTTGNYNCAYGLQSLDNLTTGSSNIGIGSAAGAAYLSSESNNILVGHPGIVADANIIRIGLQGSGASQQNKCFIAGITGVTTSNSQMVTVNTTTGQLGAATISGGTVTSVSVVSANGFAGTVATATTTPAITLSTTITGVLSGNGTAITGSAVTQYAVLVGGASNAISSVGPGSAGQLLRSAGAGANPAYTTSTYPATNAASTLLYASSANVMAALATANSAILNTSSGGVPSLATSPSISGTYTTSGGNFALPVTNAGLTAGTITVAGSVYASFFGSNNVFLGPSCGNGTVTGANLFGCGEGTFQAATSANASVALGLYSQQSVTSSSNNNSMGLYTLNTLTTGTGSNTAIGDRALRFLATGAFNLGLGYGAGGAYTGAESSNLVIGSNGVTGDNHVIRIGTNGGGDTQQSACYIAGITGVTVTGTAVLCSTAGQLGTVASSRKFKENIQDFEGSILNLRPVKFNYISDKEKSPVYGLIAEEVAESFPDLVFYRDGEIDSVKYHEMPALLLKEIQRLNKRIEALEAKCPA